MPPMMRLAPWLLLAAALLFAWATRGVLLPFIVGFAVAYLLDPLADRLETHGIGRGTAAGLIIGLFFLAGMGLLLALWPLLQSQIAGLVRSLPAIVEAVREQSRELLAALDAELGEEIGREAEGMMARAVEIGLASAGDFARRLFSGGLAVFGLLSLVVVSPVVAFYLLRDYDRILARIDGLLPREEAPRIRAILAEIDSVLAGFVRGQLGVVAMMIVIYAAGWSMIGLDYALILGLLAGIMTVIPFVGMVFAVTIALAVGFGQWGADWTMLACVAAVWLVAQGLEGLILTPRLLGKYVRLHPLWVLFAIFAGGELAGLVGVMLAVPVAAVVAVLLRHTLARLRPPETAVPPDLAA